jgi:hypothetical protein
MKKIYREFLDSKVTTSVKGDNVYPKTPPKAPKGHKNPYVATGKNKANAKTGLGDMGDKVLKIPSKSYYTMEQIQLSKMVVDNLKSNPLFAEQLVHELKNSGTLSSVIAEMLQHKATYQYISEVMSHREYGPVVCNKLVKAMNEEVAAPFVQDLGQKSQENLQDADQENEDEEDEDLDFDDLDDEEIGDEEDEEDEDGDKEEDMENPEGMGEEEMEEMPMDAPMGTPGQPGMPPMSGFPGAAQQPMPGVDMQQGMMPGDMSAMGGMPSMPQAPAMRNFNNAMMMRRW